MPDKKNILKHYDKVARTYGYSFVKEADREGNLLRRRKLKRRY